MICFSAAACRSTSASTSCSCASSVPSGSPCTRPAPHSIRRAIVTECTCRIARMFAILCLKCCNVPVHVQVRWNSKRSTALTGTWDPISLRERTVNEVFLCVIQAERVLEAGELAAQATQVALPRARCLLQRCRTHGSSSRFVLCIHQLQSPGARQGDSLERLFLVCAGRLWTCGTGGTAGNWRCWVPLWPAEEFRGAAPVAGPLTYPGSPAAWQHPRRSPSWTTKTVDCPGSHLVIYRRLFRRLTADYQYCLNSSKAFKFGPWPPGRSSLMRLTKLAGGGEHQRPSKHV